LMVRSRGAVPIECDCPIDFFITPPVRIASRILSRSRRAAFDSDPAQAAASRDNGQHWLRPSVLGTPWRDHPPQQQLAANTRATFDENRLGRPQGDVALRTPNTCIGSSSSVLRPVQPSGQHAPLPLGYERTGPRFVSPLPSQICTSLPRSDPGHRTASQEFSPVAPCFVHKSVHNRDGVIAASASRFQRDVGTREAHRLNCGIDVGATYAAPLDRAS
jgi:hypothetical protein